MKYHFILGAADPEMNRIDALVREYGASVVYAAASGRRVHAGNAYVADPVELPAGATPVWVECRACGAEGGVVIDHHRPGDPGFGRPAAESWDASSLGQLYRLLNFGEPSDEDRALAAMDHAFAGAVRGECPGVGPEAVLAVKHREIAAGTRATVEAVEASVKRFREMIAVAPTEVIGAQPLRDLCGEYLGEGYSLSLLAAQTAAVIEGVGVILRHRDVATGPEKWSLSGHVDASTVNAFMREWAPAHNLTKIYGVPDRGYAGGYAAIER